MTTRPASHVRVERSEDRRLARVILARPEVRNAFDDVLVKELQKIVRDLSGDEDLRVVELSGEGKAFCAGADLNAMKRMAGYTMEQNRRDAAELADLFRRLDEFPKPIVGRVQGAALGGGVGLVAICDVVVAADDCLFGTTEVRLGIVPARHQPVRRPEDRRVARARVVPDGRAGTTPTKPGGSASSTSWRRPRRSTAVANGILESLLLGGPQALAEAKRLAQTVRSADAARGADDHRAANRRAPRLGRGARGDRRLPREAPPRLDAAGEGKEGVIRGAPDPPAPRREPRRDRRPGDPGLPSRRASRPSRSTPRPTRARSTSAWPTRRSSSARPRRGSRISTRRSSSTRRGAQAATPSTRATASSPRTPRSRGRSRTRGLVWVGPPPGAIEAMGLKIESRERMRTAGVPVVPGTRRPLGGLRTAASASRSSSRPRPAAAARGCASSGARTELAEAVALLPARGGGGVRRRDALRRALSRAAAPRRGAGLRRPARAASSPSASASARFSGATRR